MQWVSLLKSLYFNSKQTKLSICFVFSLASFQILGIMEGTQLGWVMKIELFSSVEEMGCLVLSQFFWGNINTHKISKYLCVCVCVCVCFVEVWISVFLRLVCFCFGFFDFFWGGAELDFCLGCIFLGGCSGASSCSFFLLVLLLLLLKLQQNFQWGLLICYVIAFVFPRAFVCNL